jgi:hypothetical protein
MIGETCNRNCNREKAKLPLDLGRCPLNPRTGSTGRDKKNSSSRRRGLGVGSSNLPAPTIFCSSRWQTSRHTLQRDPLTCWRCSGWKRE